MMFTVATQMFRNWKMMNCTKVVARGIYSFSFSKGLKWLVLSALCLSIATVQRDKEPPYVEFFGSMLDVYKQGDTATVELSVRLIDPENVITEAVLFLNVVEVDAAKKYPQSAHLIFADASSPNDITKKVYTGAELKTGLATTVTFIIKDNAKPATYSLALQLFNGTNTDPNRVRVEDRIDLKNFKFVIEPK